MFALTMGVGEDIAFPDVCNTPNVEGDIPITYCEVQQSAVTAPAVYNILIDCMPALNQGSIGLVSEGDDAGVELGVIAPMVSGETIYEVGCFTIFYGGLLAQRLASVTGQNCLAVDPNAEGACLAPSQATVLTLG